MKTIKTIIKTELKEKGLNAIAAKITSIKYKSYTGGDSINVYTVNLSKQERDTLQSILDEYQYGHFDSMNDCYYHSNKNSTKERQAKYVFLNNEFTAEVKDQAKLILEKEWGITDDTSAQKKMGVWYDVAMHRTLQEMTNL